MNGGRFMLALFLAGPLVARAQDDTVIVPELAQGANLEELSVPQG